MLRSISRGGMVELGSIKVSKIDAARRQLDTSIELWFADKDPVSIHALACAAHQIIHDTNRQKGGPELIYDSAIIKDEYRPQAIALFKRPMNFFKHAEKDPYSIIELTHITTLFYILMSIIGFQHLGESPSDVERAFLMWVTIHHPEWISASYKDSVEKTVSVDGRAHIRTLKKSEFLEIFLEGRALSRIG